MSEEKVASKIPTIRLGYEVGHGNRQRYIASLITSVINEELRRSGGIALSFSIKELRALTAKRLCDNFKLTSLEVINAIRNDDALSENFVLAKLGDVESITFYSQELMWAFEDAQIKIRRNRLKLVA